MFGFCEPNCGYYTLEESEDPRLYMATDILCALIQRSPLKLEPVNVPRMTELAWDFTQGLLDEREKRIKNHEKK